MASRQDVEKRRLWAERLQRYRTSGLTVARFCAGERVSVNTFFYWAKRLGTGSTAGSARTRSSTPRSDAAPVRREAMAQTRSALESTRSGVVRFQINAAVEIAVPADCLDAIRCLAHSLKDARADRCDTFQEVVVATR